MSISQNVASPEQIAANRANAAKSTGPRTPEGLARSAVMRLRLTVTATTFRISQTHREGTWSSLPLIAHSSISSDAAVVSSSQHQGMQADTSRTKPFIGTCAPGGQVRGSTCLAGQAARPCGFRGCAPRPDGPLPYRIRPRSGMVFHRPHPSPKEHREPW